MKITLIHGTMRQSTTCLLAREACKVFEGAEITEFFLPQALPHFCTGCGACYMKGEEFCPHKEYTLPLWQAIIDADLLIFSTPVYVLHATGQMKSFLDHFGWAFMVHRPNPKMLTKAALVVCTAAGGGMKNAVKDIADSLKAPGWGISAVYSYAAATHALHIGQIPEAKKQKLFAGITKTAQKIKKRFDSGIKPSFKVKTFFNIGSLIQKRFAINPLDAAYWKNQGWLDGKKPWA